jgi:hypothetical protein
MNEDNSIERRRTVRIRRSALLKSHLEVIDRPAIKIAENITEHRQAFSLVYQEYVQSGYIPNPIPNGEVFSVFNLLPETAVFVVKSYQTVISTLSQFYDSKLFGLPMDSIYRDELSELRKKGRRIAEIGALATKGDYRWQNLFMYLCQIMYWFARYQRVDDLCITVNPKHVRFYKTIFLFEEFGPEKEYPKVAAPAVLLRLNMHRAENDIKQAYSESDFECNLYHYFHRMNGNKIEDYSEALINKGAITVHDKPRLGEGDAHDLIIRTDGSILKNLTPDQLKFIRSIYPNIQF